MYRQCPRTRACRARRRRRGIRRRPRRRSIPACLARQTDGLTSARRRGFLLRRRDWPRCDETSTRRHQAIAGEVVAPFMLLSKSPEATPIAWFRVSDGVPTVRWSGLRCWGRRTAAVSRTEVPFGDTPEAPADVWTGARRAGRTSSLSARPSAPPVRLVRVAGLAMSVMQRTAVRFRPRHVA